MPNWCSLVELLARHSILVIALRHTPVSVSFNGIAHELTSIPDLISGCIDDLAIAFGYHIRSRRVRAIWWDYWRRYIRPSSRCQVHSYVCIDLQNCSWVFRLSVLDSFVILALIPVCPCSLIGSFPTVRWEVQAIVYKTLTILIQNFDCWPHSCSWAESLPMVRQLTLVPRPTLVDIAFSFDCRLGACLFSQITCSFCSSFKIQARNSDYWCNIR